MLCFYCCQNILMKTSWNNTTSTKFCRSQILVFSQKVGVNASLPRVSGEESIPSSFWLLAKFSSSWWQKCSLSFLLAVSWGSGFVSRSFPSSLSWFPMLFSPAAAKSLLLCESIWLHLEMWFFGFKGSCD